MAIIFTVLPPTGSIFLLASLTTLGPILRDYGTTGYAIYFLYAALLVGLSLLPTYACAILAGWAFGFATGTVLAVLAVCVGSLLAYWIGILIARHQVVNVINDFPKWRAIHQAMLARRTAQTRFVVTLMRIPPTSPFGFTNFLMAATHVPLSDYIIGTFIGMIPRTAATCFVAASVREMSFEKPSWYVVGGSVAMIAMCVILGVMANRALKRLAQSGTT